MGPSVLFADAAGYLKVVSVLGKLSLSKEGRLFKALVLMVFSFELGEKTISFKLGSS
jgi:hypothetical protein